RAAKGRAIEHDSRDDDENEQEEELHRHAEHVPLAEKIEPFRIAAHRMRLAYALGETAIERERRDRHDERRHFDPRDDESVDEARERADEEREDDRQRKRKMKGLPRIAEHDRAQTHDRADREIDAARDNDEGHRQR